MSGHETSTQQAPGWWPSLVQSVCSCGWSGPVRDFNRYASPRALRADLARDGREHEEGVL